MPQIASDAKISSAMSNLGMTAPLPNLDDSQVLKAILVAMGNITGGGGGGGSAPGLPVWTYTAGAMAAGMMKTDGYIASATTISLSYTAKFGAANIANYFSPMNPILIGQYCMVLTDSTGRNTFLNVIGLSDQASYADFTVSGGGARDTNEWAGDYQITFTPLAGAITSINGDIGAITLVPPDTGWSANADTGNKATVIPSMPDISALDIMSPGFSAWAIAMNDKLKALQEALATNLRPNT